MEWWEFVGIVLSILATIAGIVIATFTVTSRIRAFRESIKQDIEKGLNDAKEDRKQIRDNLKDFINLLIERVEGRVKRTESQIDVLTEHLLNRKRDYNMREKRERAIDWLSSSEAIREKNMAIDRMSNPEVTERDRNAQYDSNSTYTQTSTGK